jgi:hypothetical protein
MDVRGARTQLLLLWGRDGVRTDFQHSWVNIGYTRHFDTPHINPAGVEQLIRVEKHVGRREAMQEAVNGHLAEAAAAIVLSLRQSSGKQGKPVLARREKGVWKGHVNGACAAAATGVDARCISDCCHRKIPLHSKVLKVSTSFLCSPFRCSAYYVLVCMYCSTNLELI